MCVYVKEERDSKSVNVFVCVVVERERRVLVGFIEGLWEYRVSCMTECNDSCSCGWKLPSLCVNGDERS